MKGYVFKFFIFVLTIAFFSFILYATGIPAVRWLDLPTAMGLIIGTSLISALGYRKNTSLKQKEKLVNMSLAITSTSFLIIGIMGSFVYAEDIPDLMVLFGIAFLTVPYALILYAMTKIGFYTLQKRQLQGVTVVEKGVQLDKDSLSTHDCFNINPAWQLTPREVEIVEQLCQGLTNKEIGEKLFITETTVKRHLANVFSKSGISNRQALIVHLHQKM